MGRAHLEKLTSTHFRCPNSHKFEAEPDVVVDKPEWDWHPFEYFAQCPECGTEAAQDPRYRGLLKAHANATGPTTAEGKARSAANLEGHPTPAETKKTRFNAITHGLTSKVANFYPAKPGRYDRCSGCSYYGHECIQDPPSTHVNPPACLSRVELFMQHRMAFETGDTGMLSQLRSDMQAGISSIINDMMLDIAQRGVTLSAPQWKIDVKTGAVVLASYFDEELGKRVTIHEVRAHPLLKILMEFIQKNNLSLEDMGMTPQVQAENSMMQGYLDDAGESKESAEDWRNRIEQQQNTLAELITRSHKRDEKVIDGEVISDG